MSFFTRRKLLTLALAAPLCEGAYCLYDMDFPKLQTARLAPRWERCRL